MERSQIAAFQRYIWHWSQRFGRHHLPWRQDVSPYRVLVSEVMLQQTQVDRVVPKYLQFVDRWPSFESLAAAAPAHVITAWQGLGYNRRGLKLHQAARFVVTQFGGQLPQQADQLVQLPGVGPYTAAAIQAFAFNQPSVVIETNIRAVMMYHFCHLLQPDDAGLVDDHQLIPLIQTTLNSSRPRDWYSALMDYGSSLKKLLPNPTRRSRQYQVQSPFEGSNRQLRGLVLKLLTQQALTKNELLSQVITKLSVTPHHVESAIVALKQEGFLEHHGELLQLVTE